ncbi:MAG: DUF1501 domain-containing protein [Planctomycetes bacterium]|nr:DUF1501 domain-containing protein [Planctomycetota bacterium]
MHTPSQLRAGLTRRHFLRHSALGLGGFAAAELLGMPPARPARARSVIYIHLAGSPSTLDLFDWKPRLRDLHMQPCPEDLLRNERFAFLKGHPRILGSPFRFARHGAAGGWFSELVPHTAAVADRIAMVHSLWTDQFNHAPAQLLIHTGAPRFGRPAMGAWLHYGLGSENRDLPGFVVLTSGGHAPDAGKSVWGSGFLPTLHQGVEFRSAGEPVLYLADPPGVGRAARRRSLDLLAELNAVQRERHGDPETDTRIAQYELAFRMQTSVPEACDLQREPREVLELYGADPGQASFANHCLLARRLVERGVRFVQLYDWGWDSHGTGPRDDLLTQLPRKCRETDRACAALILDLERRGLLEETLVVWGGEFGRTPMNEERNGSVFLGRDHHPHCFTMWLAGGGVKAGVTHGETDELGYRITKDPVHVHDLQATILHLLGIDHTRLTYRFQGREFRLTDVAGTVVHGLLA